jgi:hypothetical protein
LSFSFVFFSGGNKNKKGKREKLKRKIDWKEVLDGERRGRISKLI